MPPQSNAARKIQAVHRGRLARKDYSMLKRVQQRTAYKQYISSDTLDNDEGLVGWDGLQLLRGFTPSLQHSFRQHGGLKVHISVLAIFKKQFDDKMIRDLRWTTTPIATALTPSALPALMKDLGNMIRDGITELELRGSGWVFEMISVLEMHAARYKPLAGSATVWKLTPALAAKKALVNVKIAIDERHTECFKYAVLSALFPSSDPKHQDRSAQYEEHMDDLDWTGMKFPCPVSDIDKFEGNNGIAVNLYGWDEQRKCGYPIRLSKMQTPKQHVDLAVLVDNTCSHYCWIKHFSRFARGATEGHGGAKEYCKHCLTGFSTTKKSTAAQKLERHLSFGCAAITETRPQMPDEDEATLMFKNHDKAIKVPFVIYADFESLTEAIDPTLPDTPHTSYTATFQEHKPCGFCLYVVAADPSVEIPFPFNRPFVFRGEDAVNVFIKTIQQAEKALMPLIKGEKPMIITQEQEQEFQQATVCHICGEPLGSDRVRDHDHLTGEYRGAAHSHCNLQEGKSRTKPAKGQDDDRKQKPVQIPVFFHNLKGYDGNLIIAEVGKHVSSISAIPQNYEKMISFSFGHLRFLDSAAFLNSSLETLAENLYEGGAGLPKFVHSAKHCSKPEHLAKLLRKGVYPYDYMSTMERFAETALPAQEAFFSQLMDEGISEEDFAHAADVWTTFGCRNLGDYHDLYVKTDVLLLADIFEAHRENSLKHYELDPAHYFTTPNFAWDAMLKKTGVELELLTDYDMYLMTESGLRGGISMITHRHAKANNPYMEEYDPDEEHSYISYLDANNLYGHAMVRALPHGNFQWSEERDVTSLIERYGDPPPEGVSEGCFVKVDLHYPDELHETHNQYPLAPEALLVRQEMLSPYAEQLQQKLRIGKDTTKKLVPNLMDKHGYVCDIRALKYYVEHGLIVTKVHAVITFEQSYWMRDYIMFNTKQRTLAKNEFEKDFFKLMSNACFGKTMENLRNRVDMDFVTSNALWGDHATKMPRTLERKLASPLYNGHVVYNEDLAAIKKKKQLLVLNKPIYAGMAILDLSKLHMFEFHYDIILPRYKENAQLLFTDTDSLCYLIKTDDFYKDMLASKDLYDMSNFPRDSPFYDASNKKVLGKFKDECDGAAPSEFVGLRPKMYSLKVGEKEKKTGKGIKRSYVKKHITHDDYVRCISSEAVLDQQQHAVFNVIRNKQHSKRITEGAAMQTQTISKVGLCAYDNKRYLLGDGVSSFSYGHFQIRRIQEGEPEPEAA
jgi:hypothetical protein